MPHNLNVLHRAIRQQQPMFKIKSLPVPRYLVERFLEEDSVLRMCSPQYDFHCRFVGWIVFENAKRFLRPEDLSAGNIPSETARMANSLRFRQISFAALQGLFRALTLEYFACQLSVDGHQLAGPFQNTLFKLLIQALDFSLSLFVSGRLDNVPTSTPLCHCKLMCSHDVEDFSSSTCDERVSA